MLMLLIFCSMTYLEGDVRGDAAHSRKLTADRAGRASGADIASVDGSQGDYRGDSAY